MAPLPENLDKDFKAADFRTRYTEVAKAHNTVLAQYNSLLTENERLKQRLAWFQNQMFGARSEKIHPLPPEQQALLNLLEQAEAQSPVAAEPLPASAEKPLRRTLVQKAGAHGWGDIPAHLTRVDVPEVLSEGQKRLLDDGLLIKIRDEVSERLAIAPQSLYVKRFHRGVYAQVAADGYRTVLPLAPIESPFEKGRADSSLLAFLVVSKFVDHLPLDRIRKILLRQGVHLATSTMSTWLDTLHDLLEPLYAAMVAAVRAGPLVFADETTCRVVQEEKSHKTHSGYLWIYAAGGHLVYEYTPGRGGEHPCRFLKAFRGTLVVDGYAGYNAVCVQNGLIRAGCHAHARRKFVEAQAHYPKVRELLDLYAKLFHFEAEWTREGVSGLRRRRLRAVHSRPLWETMQRWLTEQQKTVLPKDALGDAIGYILSQWGALSVFLADGSVPLSNNLSERALRPVVLGRNNYLFFGSEKGARRGALFYTLVQSCTALGVNPQEYLEDVLGRLGEHPQSRISDLTPAGWLATESRAHP